MSRNPQIDWLGWLGIRLPPFACPNLRMDRLLRIEHGIAVVKSASLFAVHPPFVVMLRTNLKRGGRGVRGEGESSASLRLRVSNLPGSMLARLRRSAALRSTDLAGNSAFFRSFSRQLAWRLDLIPSKPVRPDPQSANRRYASARIALLPLCAFLRPTVWRLGAIPNQGNLAAKRRKKGSACHRRSPERL